MNFQKLMSHLSVFSTLAAAPLLAHVNSEQFELEPTQIEFKHHSGQHTNPQAYGKLSASTTIGPLVISNPQNSVPSVTGWQPFPVDTFSTSLNTSSSDPTNATITVHNAGTYLVNALLTLQYPNPGSSGPNDLTQYVIGIICNNQLQNDSIGSVHISTEGGHENPGLLFSCSLSDLITLPEDSTIQFVVAGTTGAASPARMEVASANATVVKVGK